MFALSFTINILIFIELLENIHSLPAPGQALSTDLSSKCVSGANYRWRMLCPLSLFVAGIFSGLICALFAYLAQRWFGENSLENYGRGEKYAFIGVIAAVVSMITFGLGAFLAVKNLAG